MPSYPFQSARNTKFSVIQPDKKKVLNSPWNFWQVKEILFELTNNLSFDFRALRASVRLDSYGLKSESMGAPGSRATCHLSDFAETWPV